MIENIALGEVLSYTIKLLWKAAVLDLAFLNLSTFI